MPCRTGCSMTSLTCTACHHDYPPHDGLRVTPEQPELNGVDECETCGELVCPQCWPDARCCEVASLRLAGLMHDEAEERGLDEWRGC